MFVQSFISKEPDALSAAQQVARATREALGERSVHLALLFVSQHHATELHEIVPHLMTELQPQVLLGCTAEGIIGPDRELEDQPAVSVWVAHLPGVELIPYHLTFRETMGGVSLLGWPVEITGDKEIQAFLVLGDPTSTPIPGLLSYLQDQFPGTPAVGGMASGGMNPGQNLLILNDRILDEGAVGVALSGPLSVETIVSQGCRPIGERFVVTRSEGNILYELGGKPALECLQQIYAGLPLEEQRLAQQGIHVGCAIDEHKSQFERGDFLVRNVVGADQESGTLVVTDLIKEGQTVQFHIRDRDTASEDLHWLLATRKDQSKERPVAGALLFSCNGRGQRLFQSPDHDVSAIRKQVGEIPVAGFFAAGEIGPVGGKNFLHGFTASVALFREPPKS